MKLNFETRSDPYPVVCPMCKGSYYTWFFEWEEKFSLDGSVRVNMISTIDYVHDDGLICSMIWM